MTLPRIQQSLRNFTACFLVANLIAPSALLAAQSHIVSSEQMQAAILTAAQNRQKNQATVLGFLSSAQAEKALGAAKVDVKLVKTAVSSLDDEELSRLAARANKAEADFAAGRLTERDLLLILLGIAALILIIVAVR